MDIKKISTVLGIILAAAAIVGGVMKYDKSLAKAADVNLAQQQIQQQIEQMNKRLDRSDLESYARDLQRRIWLLEDQHKERAKDLYEYKCLKRDLEQTQKEIEALKRQP